jgi:hypothetical protein
MLSRLPNLSPVAECKKGNDLNYIGYNSKETAKDPLLSKLLVFIKLDKQIDVQKDQELKPIVDKHQQISIQNGILM